MPTSRRLADKDMHVNIERIRRTTDRIAQFTATPGAGATRLSYSTDYRKACDVLAARARALGMAARYDAVGNLRMHLAGTTAGAPALVIGSHLDTVINGGNFDGVLGVVCGLEVAETLIEHGVKPACPIEIISFVEEEGTSFRCPLAGSKALAGLLSLPDLKSVRNEAGQSLDAAARQFGTDPDRLDEDRLKGDEIKAMLELHIEQGEVLESRGLAVGIIDCIAGSHNYRVSLNGRANHAGTTPMPLRRDALAAAAEMILAIERIATQGKRPATVATVGRILCEPNAANVIPGRVAFSIDVRDVAEEAIASAADAILQEIDAVARRRSVDCTVEATGSSPPRPMTPRMVRRLEELAQRAGLAACRMNSGALHDAAALSTIADTAMIFVPSKGGISHAPDEETDFADIEQGANLLLLAVRDIIVDAGPH